MKALRAALLTTALFALAVSPLGAASYAVRVMPGNSVFGFSSFGPSTPPVQNTGSNTNSGSSTLQTSSCLFNSCGGGAPGIPTTTPNIQSSFTTTPTYGNYYGFNGGVVRYSVFGMYNFRRTTFGGTQQPTMSGGLTPSNILGDPLSNPEPTSIALFGAGLLALGLARKRMTRKS